MQYNAVDSESGIQMRHSDILRVRELHGYIDDGSQSDIIKGFSFYIYFILGGAWGQENT